MDLNLTEQYYQNRIMTEEESDKLKLLPMPCDAILLAKGITPQGEVLIVPKSKDTYQQMAFLVSREEAILFARSLLEELSPTAQDRTNRLLSEILDALTEGKQG